MTTIEPPEEHHLPEGAHPARSIVLVNTGDGKGKSTAAFGVVMRAAARGWRVGVVQFLKSGEWHVGEEDIARRLGVEMVGTRRRLHVGLLRPDPGPSRGA